MWRAVNIEACLDHPPERVFAYLGDPDRWAEFAPAVASRRRVGDGPTEIGAQWLAVDRIGPFSVRFTDELTEWDAPTRVVWHSTAPWNSRVEYVCEAEAGGTRVRARYEGDVVGWLRMVALLPTPVLEWILKRDFTGLGRCLSADVGIDAGPVRDRSPASGSGA
jgi:uncharacterized protein YndB with AHSA1/START domain